MVLRLVLPLLFGLVGCSNLPGVAVPTVIVNLDVPAEQRWGPIVEPYIPTIIQLLKTLEPAVTPAMKNISTTVADDLQAYFPSPYAEETTAIWKMLQKADKSISLKDVVFMQILYDLTAFGCTSIVAETADGKIFHARNLDYGLPMLRNMTMRAHFQQGGNTVYSGVLFAGSVGLLTAQRPNGFTISLDERDQGKAILNLDDFYAEGKKVTWWQFGVRTAVTEQHSFSDAARYLANIQTIADVYVIIGGISRGEGVIITRDRKKSRDWWFINAEVGRWWVLETNYDHWVPPPKSDDRRDPGNANMKKLGSTNATGENIWSNVLSIPPVLNKHTIYTATMSAADPEYFRVEVRDYQQKL